MAQIKKILIANRGEIAIRIISTCREMGIETVTLYSKFDKDLPHAFLSNESYFLEGETIGETYLNQEAILSIAKKPKVDAIHPSYGFLSENPKFCDKVKKENIIFIGPSAEAMLLMGDKIQSKVSMEKLGVPLIPGYHGDDQDEAKLNAQAKRIGFPVLIKATAGGGGKGMRIVHKESEFKGALSSAKREAQNAFGNDKVLIEKYLEEPRHIEVQVFADHHRNTYHLFERECSIQRRYQKIIEETPSPALDEKLRKEICATAVKIAAGINYQGAGTVEFILDKNKKFYFLEMNTRLQVEHPISEMITGIDLVKWQIQAAQGDKFNLAQEDIKQRGHALECRIYAEDPDNEFLPVTGTIKKIGKTKMPNVRLDIGYQDGNEVSPHYDPMLAKLITYSTNRIDNIQKMIEALEDYPFLGLKTNREFLLRILDNANFKKGNITTNFIKDNDLKIKEATEEEFAHIVAFAHFTQRKGHGRSSQQTQTQIDSWDRLANFRNT